MKILRSTGKCVLTAFTLLLKWNWGYSIIHSGAYSLLSANGCYQHRVGTTLLPSYYTMKPPQKQIYSLEGGRF
jgi:hypothetical protein